METKVSLSAVGHVDETIEVEAFDIGEFYVCFRCGTLGFARYREAALFRIESTSSINNA